MAEAVAAIIRPKEDMAASFAAQGHVGKVQVGLAWDHQLDRYTSNKKDKCLPSFM